MQLGTQSSQISGCEEFWNLIELSPLFFKLFFNLFSSNRDKSLKESHMGLSGPHHGAGTDTGDLTNPLFVARPHFYIDAVFYSSVRE